MAKRQRQRRQQRRQEHAKRRGWRTRHSVITGAGLTAGALLGVGGPAQAATFVVDRSDDVATGAASVCSSAPNDCNLRGAVAASNASTTVEDEITFQSSITGITLGGSDIDINDGVYIDGKGANPTISGNNTSRIFNVSTTPSEDVGLDYLTLTAGSGGAGGAINNYYGDLHISSTVISGNSASSRGGGISHRGGSTRIEIFFSTISGNNAGTYGGGIYGYTGVGDIISSTISGNSAGSDGGGIWAVGSPVLANSTLSGNTATGDGGGVYTPAELYIYNSIVSDNGAANGPDVAGDVTAGFSLLESTSGIGTLTSFPPGAPNITGVDPQLGPLQFNGGSNRTPTRRPAATSPVIDKGHTFNYIPYDQRFLWRFVDIATVANVPGGDTSDIGAFELTQEEATIPPAASAPVASSPTGQRAAALKKCKKQYKKNHNKKKFKKCKKKANLLPA
jgi:hypothetical protein